MGARRRRPRAWAGLTLRLHRPRRTVTRSRCPERRRRVPSRRAASSTSARRFLLAPPRRAPARAAAERPSPAPSSAASAGRHSETATARPNSGPRSPRRTRARTPRSSWIAHKPIRCLAYAKKRASPPRPARSRAPTEARRSRWWRARRCPSPAAVSPWLLLPLPRSLSQGQWPPRSRIAGSSCSSPGTAARVRAIRSRRSPTSAAPRGPSSSRAIATSHHATQG